MPPQEPGPSQPPSRRDSTSSWRSPTLAGGLDSRRPSALTLYGGETRVPSPTDELEEGEKDTKKKQPGEEQDSEQDRHAHAHDLAELERENPEAARALAETVALGSVTDVEGQAAANSDEKRAHPAGSDTKDQYLVVFAPNDPDCPHNWPLRRKLLTMCIVNPNVFVVSLFASSYLFVSPAVVVQFHSTPTVANLGFTLYCLGWAFGPLVATSISDVYGRSVVLGTSMLLWTLFHVGVARAENMATLIVCRALAGTLGSASMTLGGACNVEAFTGLAIARCTNIFMALAFLGPVVGPIAGGFIGEFVQPQVSDTLGWRLLFYIGIGIGVLQTLLLFFVLPETHHATILRRRAQRLRREHPGQPYQTAIEREGHTKTQMDKLRALVLTAAVMLVEEPIVVFVGLWQMLTTAVVYSFFDGFPVIFGEGHHFSTYQVGLSFVGMGIGMLLQAIFSITVELNCYVRAVRKRDGNRVPELRLPFTIGYSVLSFVSLFWFAGVCTPDVHWIVPIIASAFYAFSFLGILSNTMLYINDAYKMRVPSARAALGFLRSAGTAPFPLFSSFFYQNVGPQKATIILACVCALASIVPPFAYKYGRAIRLRSRYADKN